MEKGIFVKVDFTGRIAATGEIFDLTSAEEAKKEGVYKEGHPYKQALVVIGSHMVLPALERQVETMVVGEERTFTVPPEQGFGVRKPELIRVVSLQKFYEKNINPVPGLFVDVDGLEAKVQSVSGGRVRLDLNHPLAGKELRYYVHVRSIIEKTDEKLSALLDYLMITATTVCAEGVATVTTKKELDKRLQELVRTTVKEWIPGVNDVVFAVASPI